MLVCSAMSVMRSTTLPIWRDAAERRPMRRWVSWAWRSASAVMRVERSVFREVSPRAASMALTLSAMRETPWDTSAAEPEMVSMFWVMSCTVSTMLSTSADISSDAEAVLSVEALRSSRALAMLWMPALASSALWAISPRREAMSPTASLTPKMVALIS